MQYAVIMAGGSGQRLWPLSRQNRPKQIINAFEGQSLLRQCVDRMQGVFASKNIFVVTNAEYADIVRKHLPELPRENIIGEPVGRDTANAIGLAATILHKKSPDSIMGVFSADQIIEPVEPLHDAIRKALTHIEQHPEELFTFGIKAAYAHTGFGYLKRGEPKENVIEGVCPVEAFKEKPNRSTASKYIRSGQYCWNSGMFVWKTATILEELKRALPKNAERFQKIADAWNTPQQEEVLNAEFPQLDKISIDFAVMEQAEHVSMCELDCHWVDLGSYQALAERIGTVDEDENVTSADTRAIWLHSNNNMALSTQKDHLIAAIHAEDLIIVHTEDVTMICHREETSHLKSLLQRLGKENLEQYL